MDSTALGQHGFSAWHAFNRASIAILLAQTPLAPGTYVIRCRTAIPRKHGRPDILYVGSAADRSGHRRPRSPARIRDRLSLRWRIARWSLRPRDFLSHMRPRSEQLLSQVYLSYLTARLGTITSATPRSAFSLVYALRRHPSVRSKIARPVLV